MNDSTKNTPVTMQELADIAGVTRGTVSRALSDSPRVNPKTKNRILSLAKKHNYRVNQRARNFRLQKTGVISVVFMLNVKSEQHMSDPFFLEMLGGIADCLAEHDLDLFLAHAPIESVLDLQSSRVFQNSDGVIFIGQGEQHEELNAIANSNAPIVVWGASMPDQTYCGVGGDNLTGGFLATDHLLKLGRRSIAFFGETSPPEIASRFEGYKKALALHQVDYDPKLHIEVPFDMDHASEAIEELLASDIKFDAAVCSSDVMALGAIATINDHGLTVPGDIAIVGYDDIGIARYSSPALTTVSQNIRWGGRVLVESLLSILKGQKVANTTLASELVVRQSSGALVARKP